MKASLKFAGATALSLALAFSCQGAIFSDGGGFMSAWKLNDAFTDACASEVLDRMGTRTWLITDGLLDKSLRKAAAARGRELNIICINGGLGNEEKSKAYCNLLADLVEKKKITAGEKSSDDLVFTLRELGLISFLKMWFKNDPNIMNEVMTMGCPDLWFWANCRPVPDGLCFKGVKDVHAVDGLKLKSDFEAFWKKVKPSLGGDRQRGKGSRAIREMNDGVVRRRMELLRHLGLVANNIGVLLEDLGHDTAAFEMYERVLREIDCDNICALLNEYEMIRAGKKVALGHRHEVEQRLKEVVEDPTSRYMTMLSNYYGYIRSPEYFVRKGLGWARTGATGWALASLMSAIDLTPGASPPKELLNMMASFYAQGQQVEKSREVYLEVLSKDSTNHEALMGLWRLSLQEGAIEEAKLYLKRAVAAPTKADVIRFDEPLLYMMDNNLEEARLSLLKITDLHGHSIQAWALLAGVVLQQADMETDPEKKKKILSEQIENRILPHMEGIADSPRDFFVQMTRALTLMRKGTDPETMKQARAALEIAWKSRPLVSVGGMVLDLDFRLLDRASAERHALQILGMDPHHPFANWVMGSIRMGGGKYPEAERYLRASAAASHPLAAAQNDLAELLRRRGNLVEAEQFARAATKSDPKLYVAWETLASTLLDQGKDIDEAERCILKAIELSDGTDLRMQLTLARVQVAKARSTIRALGKCRDELSDRDKDTLDKLRKQVMGN